MTDLTAKIAIGVITSAVSGSMAFGISQMAIGKDVALNRQAIVALTAQFVDERERTDKRIFKLSEMMEKITEQNIEVVRLSHELITIIKLQNQIQQGTK